VAASRESRLLDIDALRGFALFGILAVNIWSFANAYYASGTTDPAFGSAVDDAVRFLVSLLFETKFYLLFSFLFGYSFTLQMDSAERAGAAFRPRMLRRQHGLLAIGLAHGVLLYPGDILSTYAILGLVLLALRGISPRSAVKTAIVLIAVSGTLMTLLGLADIAYGAAPNIAGIRAQAAETTAALTGSPASVIREHARQFPLTVAFVLLVQGPSAIAMFLLGFAAGRRRLFADIDTLRPKLYTLLRVCLPIGLAGSITYAYLAAFHPGSGAETLGFGIDLLTAPALTAAYVAAALIALQTARGRRVARVLAPAGRTALSNYLLQSLVLGVIFTAFGFELIGKLAPIVVLAIVPVVFAAQLAVSAWWLRGHTYGPLEWLLRAITNASRPNWRRRHKPEAAPLPRNAGGEEETSRTAARMPRRRRSDGDRRA